MRQDCPDCGELMTEVRYALRSELEKCDPGAAYLEHIRNRVAIYPKGSEYIPEGAQFRFDPKSGYLVCNNPIRTKA